MRDAKGRFCKERKFVVGDIIVANTDTKWYRKGDIGTVERIQGNTGFWANFNSHGNKHVVGDGEWFTLWTHVGSASPKPKKTLAGGKVHTYGPSNEPNPKILDITPGSVVRLKSGGPDMTVREDHETDKSCVWCHWFDGPRINVHMLAKVCLEVVR